MIIQKNKKKFQVNNNDIYIGVAEYGNNKKKKITKKGKFPKADSDEKHSPYLSFSPKHERKIGWSSFNALSPHPIQTQLSQLFFFFSILIFSIP